MDNSEPGLALELESAAGLEYEMLAMARVRAALEPRLTTAQAWELAQQLSAAIMCEEVTTAIQPRR